MYMISKGQMLIVKAGETVHLECEFNSESFSLFENPTVWRKAQRLEESQINMMGNLLEPFASAKRFKATFQPQAPRFLFGLAITGQLEIPWVCMQKIHRCILEKYIHAGIHTQPTVIGKLVFKCILKQRLKQFPKVFSKYF